MNITLTLPALNWDAPEQLPPLNTPALNHLLRFGHITRQTQPTSALFAQSLWRGSLRDLACESVAMPSAQWQNTVLLSPVWQQMGMHNMNTLGGGDLAISEAEAQTWCSELNDFYRADGVRFQMFRPDLWLLTLPQAVQWDVLPVFDVLGQVDGTMRAEGADAKSWLQWQTELQMWLHAHALNRVREHNRLPAVNGVWLWQDLRGSRSPEMLLASDSVWAEPAAESLPYDFAALQRLLADKMSADGIQDIELFDECLLTARHTANAWAYQDTLHELEQRWFAPIADALKTGAIKSFCLRCESGELRVQAKTQWRFWKSKKTFQGEL
ncbi:MAG: hypothetical protein Q4E16_04340 [Neisseria sp.]|nr:hypothetical protein [Neisseria sp.]